MADLKEPQESRRLQRLKEQWDYLNELYKISKKLDENNKEQIKNQNRLKDVLEHSFKIRIKSIEQQKALLDRTADEIEREEEIYQLKLNEYKLAQKIKQEKEAEVKINEKLKKQEQEFKNFSDYFAKKTSESDARLNEKRSFINRNLTWGTGKITQVDNIRQSVTKDVWAKYTKNGIADEAHYDEIYAKIQSGVDKRIQGLGIGTSAEGLLRAANLYSSATKVFSDTIDTLKNTVLALFSDGINRQSSVYESTFSNFSARTNTTRGNYLSRQFTTGYRLLNSEYGDNVGVSDVMGMWNELASKGMNSEDIFTNALDNVITQKIVPYLDVTSQSVNILNNRLDNSFIKDIRGITASNLEIAGNNFATQDLLNTIIEQVQPMSDAALQNLTEGSAELTALINKIAPVVGVDAAKEYATMLFKMQNYGGTMLQSGSTFDKLSAINALGYDINNPLEYNDIVGSIISTSQLLGSLGPGYNGTMNTFHSQIVAGSTGMSQTMARAQDTLKREGLMGYDLASSTNIGSLKGYTDTVNAKYANGDYQTATQMQRNWAENAVTGISGIKQQLGVFGSGILKGVYDIFNVLVGGKLFDGIAKVFGMTGGKNLGSILASGGGATIGALGALAIPALGTAISEGISESNKRAAAENASSYVSELDSVKGIGDVNSAATIHGYADITTAGGKGAGSVFGNMLQSFAQGLNVVDKVNLLVGTDPVAVNKAIWDEATVGAQASKETLEFMVIAFANAMLAAGNDSSIIPKVLGSGINLEGIKTEAHYLMEKYPKNFFENIGIAGNKLVYNALGPNSSRGGYNFTLEDMRNWGTFRQGLSRVPYDNFPAILHEGEAILTASTTNSLNELVQEYKNNKASTAQLDVIVQNQTNQLIEKMNEIISAISLTSGTTNIINESQRKIKQSMTSLTSTLAFQN